MDMRKIYLTLLGVIISLSLFAQTYIWKDGKIEQTFSTGEIRFNKISAENFATIPAVEQQINSLYLLFGEDKSFRNRLACGFQGLNTDIEHGNKNSGRADYNIYSMITSSGDLSASNGKDPWGYLTRLTYNSQLIIDGICTYCDTTDVVLAYYLGEALFLHAFALSEMVKLWGDIPTHWKVYRVNTYIIPTEPKQDRNMLYEMMRADLKRAANLLPWANEMPDIDRSAGISKEPTANNTGSYQYMERPTSIRNYTGVPTKAAALGLLARIDLNYAGYAVRPNNLGVPADGYSVRLNITDAAKRQSLYQEALEACAQIIKKEGNFKLLADYEQVFRNICADETDYTKSEVIWEIPFADGARGQVLQYNCPHMSNALKGLKNNTSGSSNSAISIVPTLYFDYEAGDKRRDVSIAPFKWAYDNANSVSYNESRLAQIFPEKGSDENILYQQIQPINNFYCGKYRVEWMARERDGNDDGVNFPILRYADILLMFCEASLGGITGDTPANNTGLSAQALFDRVRNRAGVATKSLTMNNLIEERKLEFAGEYLRKYDLIRWGKLRSTMEYARYRLDNLDAHTGEFANTGDTIYFKYRYVGSEYSYDSSIKGYVIDQMTFTRPANYDETKGWLKKCIFNSDSSGRGLSYYMLFDYDHPEYLDSHQLWPIFGAVISPDGYLWNDYDY